VYSAYHNKEVCVAAEENQTIARRFIEEGWNQGKIGVVDELVTEDFVEHALWPNAVPLGPAEASPREQLKYDITEFRKGLPDLQVTIDQQVTEGDKVVTVATNRGTTTGKPISWVQITIDRIVDGKIAERWLLWDRLGFWQQLGIVPATTELSAQLPT
jgi:predicted SnoaL-like aldol condensation-catalyzing enzyme